MRNDIEQYRLERGIPYLLHFTRAENLPSILANGLVPRSELDCGHVSGAPNDDLRLDGRRDFNCLSIAFPNAPMFYRFRSNVQQCEWPILVIHPGIMARRNTLFCMQNAASNGISQASEAALSSIHAFQELYAERDGLPSRAEQFLKPCDPTNVQAEVLVQGTIPPEAIYCVIFESVPCQQQHAAHVGSRQSLISNRRGYYGTRLYYRQWGHGKNG